MCVAKEKKACPSKAVAAPEVGKLKYIGQI